MSGAPLIPLLRQDVSADFLTRALSEIGLLQNQTILNVDARVIGEGAGFMGEVVDIQLTLSPEAGAAPRAVIVKIPTALKNRRVGQTLGVYEREIRFYRELQPELAIRTPRHYFSAMDVTRDPADVIKLFRLLSKMPLWLIRLLIPLSNWLNGRTLLHYILVIEHLGEYRAADQVSGCSPNDAKMALRTMAKMHAQFWNSNRFHEFPWLIPLEYAAKPVQMLFLDAVDDFKAENSHLGPTVMALLDWLKKHYFELVAAMATRPKTLLHGDFRLDNLCFDDQADEAILFDWQTVAIGSNGSDLAYFLSAAVDTDAGDDPTEDLLAFYRTELASHGVLVSEAELKWEYECGLVAVLHRCVPAMYQDMLDLGEGRGNQLIDTWIRRVVKKLGCVDPDRLLEGPPEVRAG